MYPYMEDLGHEPSPALYYDREHARKTMLLKDPLQIERDANVSFDASLSCFTFLSLNQSITVSYPECHVTFTETGKNPTVHWQMPILHYLAIADGTPLSREPVAIRDLKKHIAHPELFEHETGGTLYRYFDGKDLSRLRDVCSALGGEIKTGSADLYAIIPFLPNFPVYIKLWMSDDEIHGSGKMLFDKNSLHYLDEMDVHVIGPLLVKFLGEHYSMAEHPSHSIQ